GTWYGKSSNNTQITSTLGAFYNTFKNQINLGTDPNNDQISTYINIYRYRTLGAVWEGALYTPKLEAKIGISYIGRHNRLSENELSVPKTSWSPEITSQLSYPITKWGVDAHLFYKFSGKRTTFETISGSPGDPINRAVLSAFHLPDLSLHKKVNTYIDITGGIRNLFNVTQVMNSSIAGDGTAHNEGSGYSPISYGRSFFLGVQFSWTKNY